MPAAARKIAMTDRTLKALKAAPAGKRETLWDAIMPGLAVRVTDKGRRSFVVVRRLPGAAQPTWATIGEYPLITLAEAREKARLALGALAAGEHPKAQEAARQRAQQEAARRDRARTFGSVAELFIANHVSRTRTARATEALIRRELIPILGEKPIGEIRRRDIIDLIEEIVARGVPQKGHRRPKSGGRYAARHAFAALSKLFNWAVSRDIEGLDASPCSGVKVADLLGAVAARDRVLSEEEMRAVWGAAGEMGYPFGALLQILLLTGQRLAEIAEARWSEIDLAAATLTIPAERMKGKATHVVPLTPAVAALFAALPRFAGGDYVFTTTAGRRPVSGFSKAAEKARKLAGLPHWALHDLRRTARTGLAQTGASVFVAELVIAHTQTGVHAVYDLHKYDTEKRAALMAWEARLLGIVGQPAPTAPNIVPMRRERVRA